MSEESEVCAKERLSDVLRSLLLASEGRAMKVSEMVEIMQGRGLYMVVVLLCLPFLSPVTIPGLSLPFGLAIAVCGLRIAFGRKPWLPGVILRREISHTVLEKMVGVGCAIYERMERMVRPRMVFLFEGAGWRHAVGAAIALAGVLLSLPIPPPFPLTNTLPGFAVIFFALGLMERDGILVIAGYVLTAVATCYVGGIVVLGKESALGLWRLVIGG